MFMESLIFKYIIMLKNISNVGKTLTKAEQQTINGGIGFAKCSSIFICQPGGTGADGERCFLNGGIEGTMSNGRCCANV